MARKSKPKVKPKARRRKRRPGKRGRPVRGTEDWGPVFLLAIRNGLHVRDACVEACINGTMPYQRRDTDEAFRLAWEESAKVGTHALEAEAARRAYNGTLKPVFYLGMEVGSIREYSDTLLMFLLKSRRPKKYRDSAKFELTGKDGGPIGHAVQNMPDITSEAFEALTFQERVQHLQEVLHALNRSPVS